jgi:hypothetical protein
MQMFPRMCSMEGQPVRVILLVRVVFRIDVAFFDLLFLQRTL